MVYAQLVCSDEGCSETVETWGDLGELEALACECGCALQLISVSEVVLVELARPPAPARKLARIEASAWDPGVLAWEPALPLAA
jgi:hypothetical protein